MRGVQLVVVLGLVVFGCKRDTASGGGQAPASTTEADALWAMAPEGAQVGVVISPRAIAMTEHAWTDIRALFAQAPELAPLNVMLGQAIAETFGKPDVTLADVGLAPGKGAAFFASEAGGAIAILPVADRDKFIAATHGTKGADGDKVGKATCKTVNGSYVCSRQVDQFAKLGKAKLLPALEPVGTRGDVEVAGTIPLPGKPIGIAAVLQMSRGTVVARVTLSQVPAPYLSVMKAGQIAARGDLDHTAGFGVISLAPLLATAPPLPLLGGVTLAELAKSLGGPATLHIPPGSMAIDLRIPVTDPKPATTLIEHCTEFPPFAAIGATVSDGTCHIAVPQLGYAIDFWVDGKDIRIGKKGAADAGVAVPMGAIGEELAKQPAVFAFWGRGTVFGSDLGQMPKLPAVPTEALMFLRAFTLLDELGGSVRVDGDKVKIVFALRTMWANPDDVVAKIVAISPRMVFENTAFAAAKVIADGSPSSPFAADFKAGSGGLMAPMAVVGMLGAVAVPAFMDYMKRSKHSEAELQLNKLAKSAKAYYAENATFPAGDAPLTPPTPCCQGPRGKCAPAGAGWTNPAWTTLDFQIDEPTLFQYRYHSDGKTLEAEAIGDLDCDGNMITYKLLVESSSGNPTTRIEAPMPNSD